jgi:hypothetical protein
MAVNNKGKKEEEEFCFEHCGKNIKLNTDEGKITCVKSLKDQVARL